MVFYIKKFKYLNIATMRVALLEFLNFCVPVNVNQILKAVHFGHVDPGYYDLLIFLVKFSRTSINISQ